LIFDGTQHIPIFPLPNPLCFTSPFFLSVNPPSPSTAILESLHCLLTTFLVRPAVPGRCSHINFVDPCTPFPSGKIHPRLYLRRSSITTAILTPARVPNSRPSAIALLAISVRPSAIRPRRARQPVSPHLVRVNDLVLSKCLRIPITRARSSADSLL
jgi:hypothetical protein